MEPDPQANPLGIPVRREDWYLITESFSTATVTVYAGEVVGCSRKVFTQLSGWDPPGEGEEDRVVVIQYADVVQLLKKNGFRKF